MPCFINRDIYLPEQQVLVKLTPPIPPPFCYGAGYAMIDMMEFDWVTKGTGVGGRRYALVPCVKYIVFIRG
jgi:hypothetical protein